MPSLDKIIKTAINNEDVETLSIIKDALDKVHSTGESVKIDSLKITITPENLPPDSVYETIVKILEVPLKIPNPVKNMRLSKIPDLWMGSLPKFDTIKQVSNGIMMPKFDGVSAGLKFIRDDDKKVVLQLAQTRGVKANITSKMSLLTEDLLKALNAKYRNEKGFMMCIRGEVVLKNKSSTKSAPAPFIAGKINGGEDVFRDALDQMEFIPYEIMRTNDKRFTQEETFKLFRELGCLKFEPIPVKSGTLDEVKEAFAQYESELHNPLDGIVYCSKDWTYPITEAETMSASYGKYAWKPSKDELSTVVDFEYSISRDGKIEVMMIYDEITIDGKNYSRAKVGINRLLALKGIGIGSEIVVKLSNGISPFITDFVENPSIIPYELPTECPFCKRKLTLSIGKNSTLRCKNENCPEVITQKYKNFLKVLGFKGISDKRLEKLDSITLDKIIQEYINERTFVKEMKETTVNQLFQAIGYGGKQTTSKKLSGTSLEDNTDALIPSVINDVLEVLHQKRTDVFIADVEQTLRKLLCKK